MIQKIHHKIQKKHHIIQNKKTDGSISYWKNRNRTFLIDQLETHNGVILTKEKEQKMGGRDKYWKKIKNITNCQLADMLIEVLKITK